jgi:hypothetical protein
MASLLPEPQRLSKKKGLKFPLAAGTFQAPVTRTHCVRSCLETGSESK